MYIVNVVPVFLFQELPASDVQKPFLTATGTEAIPHSE